MKAHFPFFISSCLPLLKPNISVNPNLLYLFPYEIYDSLPLLALLSSAHRVKLSAFLRAVFSVLCECCIPNKLLTIAPGVINFGLL